MAPRRRRSSEGGAPAVEAAPPPEQPPEPPDDGGGEPRTPVHVFSYPAAPNVFILASVWDRQVHLAGGERVTAHDVSLRKRYRDSETGEWKTLYSFRGSEIHVVVHALNQACAWILDARANALRCPP